MAFVLSVEVDNLKRNSMKRYTTIEAAAKLGTCESTIRYHCRLGRIGEKIGRNYSLTDRDLAKFRTLDHTPGPKAKEKSNGTS